MEAAKTDPGIEGLLSLGPGYLRLLRIAREIYHCHPLELPPTTTFEMVEEFSLMTRIDNIVQKALSNREDDD